ncbi:universal stress protein [Idiomarina xiamenensis]|uniref:UspA, universal stress protein n=1 Tax=Idiomarina xiamenensis 10-D-4 TaxID=740709 RepID=K2KMM2_9GAMM|nr:universal stress protein [Idiomarina xiamenensis]EKE83674.1 UspA, universal stress protein [Idiomarina xiamenensis 10-D-4]
MSQVIACIDASSAMSAVVSAASWAAERLRSPLTLLHLIEHGHAAIQQDMTGNIGLGSRERLLAELAALDEQKSRLLLEQGQQLLQQAKQQALAQVSESDVLLRQRHGQLADSLAEQEVDTRLVVIGMHGEQHGVDGHIGSQLETVLRRVKKPILLTPDSFKAPCSVMLAFDGSRVAQKACELLAASPLCQGLAVHIVYVGAAAADIEAKLDDAAQLLVKAGHEVSTTVIEGEVEPMLHQYQHQHGIDLMVMGAYGHSKLRQFFVGSTTTAMLAASKSPILILR